MSPEDFSKLEEDLLELVAAGVTTFGVIGSDAVGLRFELTPPDSPSGLDLVESVRRGDLDAMSFGFRTLDDCELTSGAPHHENTTPPSACRACRRMRRQFPAAACRTLFR